MNTNALISIWNHTQQHKGTSGARVCAAVLLGLYNGARFPMDITDLRILDAHLLNYCLAVITADSVRCQYEVHDWLNRLTGRTDMGYRFELLAWEYKTFARGRAKKADIGWAHVGPLVIEEPSAIRGKEATSMIFDELVELSPTAARIYDMDMPRGKNGVVDCGDGKTFDTNSVKRWQLPSDRDPNVDAPRGMGAKRQAAMLNLSYDQVTPEGLRLTAEQAAAVRAMTDNLPARTNQPLHDFDTLPNLFQQRNRTE